MACADTLLPEPDSPTMPRVCPVSTLKLTPRTAGTRPSGEAKLTCRSSTSSSATGCSVRRREPHVRHIAHPGVRIDEQIVHGGRGEDRVLVHVDRDQRCVLHRLL